MQHYCVVSTLQELIDAKLEADFWAESIQMAIDTLRRRKITVPIHTMSQYNNVDSNFKRYKFTTLCKGHLN